MDRPQFEDSPRRSRSAGLLAAGLVAVLCPMPRAHAAPPGAAEFEQTHGRVAAAQPDGLSMELKLPKTRFYQGEVIPATLAFKNSSQRPYYTWAGEYDRSGRIPDLGFRAIGEQGNAVADPLEEHFKHGAFVGGGLGNFSSLGEWQISLPANEWLRFDRPGTYRLYGWSHRVTPGSSEDRYQEGAARPGPAELVSAIVTIQIDPLPAAQEQEVLGQIRKDLESKRDEVAREAMTRLRHLQTPAARDLARSLLGGSHDFEVHMALLSAPHPEAEAAAILRDVRAGLLAIDSSTLYLYRNLKGPPLLIAPDHVLDDLLDAARETLHGDLQSAVASRNLIALFEHDPKDATTRALAVAHQLELSDASTDALLIILNREQPPGADERRDADFLPLLRRAAGPPRHRGTALKILVRLEKTEARQRIVDDIQHPPFKLRGHGGNVVYDLAELCSLPPEMLLPELDETFRQRLQNARRPAGADEGIAPTMMLVARYGTPALLSDVLKAYEPFAGRWACSIQADALRYCLRCDAKKGVELLQKALAAREKTGCYHAVLTDVLRRVWQPEALPVVLAALDDPDEEVWQAAAEVLSLHAVNPEVAEKMIATAERLGALPLPSKGSDQNTTIYRQDRLVKYLAEGDAWQLSRPQLTRLKALPHLRQDTRAMLDQRLAKAEK